MSSPRKILRSQENTAENRVANEYDSAKRAAAIEERTDNEQRPPQAPRSAFMCFTECKKKEIMSRRALTQDNRDVLNLLAQEWRLLSDRDRAYWDEEARNDKVRFVREKAEYKGPWAIPKRRAKKHPLAPKRPMSAFLQYSQKRRALVKSANPDMGNTDVSRLLGEAWRNASPAERAPYVEQEQRERAVYKAKIKKFRDEQARLDAASRTSHQTVQKMVEYPPQQLYEGNSAAPNSFDCSHVETVEEAANKADQRMVFRHAFSAPAYASYRATTTDGPIQAVAERQETDQMASSSHAHAHPNTHAYSHAHSHAHMHAHAHAHAPAQFHQPLDMEDDNSDSHYQPSRSRYFQDSMNFSFYGRYH